ncbi:hypothetical protein EDB81DRAFT_805208 [Dactylonectria macrodidyma]|uniref:Uncharacterized protein n=1 Tax=Dactylonectria macrodidyma TaxID=307937 RepID=A0A9P9EC63_9HYPO|nr:hypothetical protein EDB81DRAFT_805208 [Dactylonectria macrodidyma]
MEAEDTDAMHLSSTQPPSRDEQPWLVDRIPSRLDAERAHRPLDPAFVLSFRHAIFNEAARDVPYLNDETEAIVQSSSPTMEVYYPVARASVPPSIPPEVAPERLLERFRQEVYPNMSLLCLIPIEAFHAANLSGYLGYAMATLGAMMDPVASSITHGLWSFANTLSVIGLEMDNREARNLDMVNAWVLLGTYGALCGDVTSWQQTNTGHGYIGTAARRLYNNTNADPHCNAVPALLLADVLRSIHYGHPLTISLLDCLAGSTTTDLSAVNAYLVLLKGHAPAPGLSRDASLTSLIAILADIHKFALILHPLSQTVAPPAGARSPATLSEMMEWHTPFIPFSANNEARLVRRRLSKALRLWATSYLADSQRDTATLYYFCELYLALPCLQTLPAISKYPPRVASDGPVSQSRQQLADAEVRNAPEAETYAWQILENVNETNRITASWIPITIFYASLVVWRLQILKPEGAGRSSPKVLLLFKEELKKMSWPCCRTMISTLDALLF